MRPDEVKQLLDAAVYSHPVEKLRLIETHISWVILTGDFVYKIKKPVDLGFVNFTSLALRRHFCEEELRLNRRTAAELYLGVVPIAQTRRGFRIGEEPAIEYAVRMRQFPADARLDHQLEAGQLTGEHAVAMANTIAGFNASLEPKPDRDPVKEFGQVSRFALDNFDQIRSVFIDDTHHPLLSRLEKWTREQLQLLRPAFEERVRNGLVLECHGDLHLANMVRLDDRIVLFDCLEFDPGLRWLDPMNDIAFLVMDLMAHRRKDLAVTFINAYLEKTGDYPGLAVLRFYLVYRCLVRAKVSALQPAQEHDGAAEKAGGKTRRYLELAQSLVARATSPCLFLMHGFSGAGKSWLSQQLMQPLGAIRVRSDLERKRLHGLGPGQSSASGIQTGMYTATASAQTYDCLARYCEIGLKAGFTMIADAAFLQHGQRGRFLELARRLRVEPFILDCSAAVEILRERIEKRAAGPEHVSEADLQVLRYQLSHHDPLTVAEQACVIRVATDQGFDLASVLRQIQRRCQE